jgi:hypothetical protein
VDFAQALLLTYGCRSCSFVEESCSAFIVSCQFFQHSSFSDVGLLLQKRSTSAGGRCREKHGNSAGNFTFFREICGSYDNGL